MKEYISELKNISLLGQINIDKKEYDELVLYARNFVQNCSSNDKYKTDLRLSVALVQIAIRNYEDGNFWDNFLNSINLSSAYKNKLSTVIGSIFINTIKKHNLYFYSKDQRNEYVQNILIHSMVPNSYFNQFCNFLYSFYEINLRRNYDESTILDELADIAIYIASTLKNNSDSFTIESSSGCKSYLLLKSSRVAMADLEKLPYLELFINILENIDNYFYNSILPKNDSRINGNFIKWIEKESTINNVEGKGRRKRGLLSSQPYFKINFLHNSFSLVVPEQKIRMDNYCDDGVYFCDENNEYKLSANLKGINIIYTSEVIIKDYQKLPFEDIMWTIKLKENKTYNYNGRNILFFDEDGNQINKLKNGRNYIIIKNNIKYEKNGKIIENENVNIPGCKCLIAYVDDDFCAMIDGVPVGKLGVFNSKPIKKIKNNVVIFENETEKHIDALVIPPIINFEIDSLNYYGSVIYINDKMFRICEIDKQDKIKLKNGKLGISIDVSKLKNFNDGFYEILIDEPLKNKYLYYSYYLLTKTKFYLTKKRYMPSDAILLNIYTSLELDEKNSQKLNDNYYILNDGEYEFKFILDQYYLLTYNVPVFKWRFDDNIWYLNKTNINYRDLHSIIEVYCPFVTEPKLSIVNKHNEYDTTINGIEVDEFLFRFNISDFIQYINLYEGKNNRFNVSFEFKSGMSSRVKWEDISCIYRKNIIPHVEIKELNGVLGVHLNIVGVNRTYCKIWVKDLNNIDVEKISRFYLNNGFNECEFLNKNEVYKIDFFQEISDDFGFESDEFICTKYDVGYIDVFDLSNCVLTFNKVFNCEKEFNLVFQHEAYNLIKIEDDTYISKLRYIDRKYNKVIEYDYNLKIQFIDENTILINSYDIEDDCEDDLIYNLTQELIESFFDEKFISITNKQFDLQYKILENIKANVKIRRDV